MRVHEGFLSRVLGRRAAPRGSGARAKGWARAPATPPAGSPAPPPAPPPASICRSRAGLLAPEQVLVLSQPMPSNITLSKPCCCCKLAGSTPVHGHRHCALTEWPKSRPVRSRTRGATHARPGCSCSASQPRTSSTFFLCMTRSAALLGAWLATQPGLPGCAEHKRAGLDLNLRFKTVARI